MTDRSTAAPSPPRAAASLILIRDATSATPRVLTGKRKASARFMPDARVFPGGAVDREDDAAASLVAPDAALAPACAERLGVEPRGAPGAAALALAAIRETFEETGRRVGVAEDPGAAPEAAGASWTAFAASGARPRLSGLVFILRAITPPSMKIRFDARIFVVDADAHALELDDFSGADGELEDLRWMTFSEAVTQPMPFPTVLALAEIMAGAHLDPARPVPFLDQATERGVIVGL